MPKTFPNRMVDLILNSLYLIPSGRHRVAAMRLSGRGRATSGV
jgi:hypothetical protein